MKFARNVRLSHLLMTEFVVYNVPLVPIPTGLQTNARRIIVGLQEYFIEVTTSRARYCCCHVLFILEVFNQSINQYCVEHDECVNSDSATNNYQYKYHQLS